MEILRYLKSTRQVDRPWVALDDDARLFPDGCPQLILCRDGFREAEEAALRSVFEGLSN